MTLVKICGVTDPAIAEAAVAAGASHIGLVFFPPSPRNLSLDAARTVAAHTPAAVGRVGVFVDADDALIDAAIAAGRLTALQLHGAETPARAAGLKARLGIEVWRGHGIRTAADVAAARRWRGAVDRLIFDAKPPPGAPLPGGNGVALDWRLIGGADIGMAWGLSGGLSAATVADAIRATAAPLVDVSSGVEDAPGVKSAAKVALFMEAVRRA